MKTISLIDALKTSDYEKNVKNEMSNLLMKDFGKNKKYLFKQTSKIALPNYIIIVEHILKVSLKGKNYDIPILIYFPDSFPLCAPEIYLKKISRHIQINKSIPNYFISKNDLRVNFLLYKKWKKVASSIHEIIDYLIDIFNRFFPLFSCKEENNFSGYCQIDYKNSILIENNNENNIIKNNEKNFENNNNKNNGKNNENKIINNNKNNNNKYNNNENNNNENNNNENNNNENNNKENNNNENNNSNENNNFNFETITTVEIDNIENNNDKNKNDENNRTKIILSDYILKTEPRNFPQLYENGTLNNIKSRNEILTIDNTLLFFPENHYKTISSISNTIKNFEYPIQITYNIPYISDDIFLFHKFRTNELQFNKDFILFNTTEKNFTARMLYDYIYEKNRKFLISIIKSDEEIWWRTKRKNIKFCYPFIIRITKIFYINNITYTKCSTCPWFNFCPGCLLDPNKKEYLKLDLDNIIHVEFCKYLYDNELLKNNLNKISHINLEEFLDENDQIEKNLQIESNLEDCFKLFLISEKLEDPLTCAYCQSRQFFSKQNNFDKFPPVLIISLKRFKFSSHYHNKISTFIKYPTENLELKNEKFDLYGVIFHFGNLNFGHYTACCKINNEWIYFNDSNYSKKNSESIVNRNAYILIYINKKNPETFMYYNIMKNLLDKLNEEEDNKFLKKKIKESKIIQPNFFQGEPVDTDYGKGYFINDIEGSDCLKNIKYTFGSGTVNVKNIRHETNLVLGYISELDKK